MIFVGPPRVEALSGMIRESVPRSGLDPLEHLRLKLKLKITPLQMSFQRQSAGKPHQVRSSFEVRAPMHSPKVPRSNSPK